MVSKEEHYEQLLGLDSAWKVSGVELDLAVKRVVVEIGYRLWDGLKCPECGSGCALYDYREMRQWRHLDTMQFETILRCEVPRCRCPEHGVKTIQVPWAKKGAGFTLMFESFAIEVLQACSSVKAAAELMRLNWHQINEIKKRAVERGLKRREDTVMQHMGIDEKSFRKGHRYVSVLTDLDGSRIIEVASGRDQLACDNLFESLSPEQRDGVDAIAMDMWRSYINAAQKHLSNAAIVHDRFHISKHLNEAINAVRKQEHRMLMAQKDESLKCHFAG